MHLPASNLRIDFLEEGNAEAINKYGGRFLVRGAEFEAPEGTPRARNIVLEFPSYEAAVAHAKGCPVLTDGGTVEVHEAIDM